jgi:chemotaxis protein histidine kinase CheA
MNETLLDLREFLLESHKMLDHLEPQVAHGGKDPDQEKRWRDSYALIRALREDSAALGFKHLDQLAQRAELVLARLANGFALPQPPTIGFLLNVTEGIRQDLYTIEAHGGEPATKGASANESFPFHGQNVPSLEPLPGQQKSIIFRTPDDGRMLIPFDRVMRIEAFDESTVEKGVEFDALRRPDRLLPLVDVSGLLPERRIIFRRPPVKTVRGQSRQVINYVTPQGEVVLVVDAVLDVLKARVQIELPSSRSGVKGSMMFADRVTELLDIPVILAKCGIAPPLKAA